MATDNPAAADQIPRTDGDGEMPCRVWVWTEGDVLLPYQHAAPRDLLIYIGGQIFHHVSTHTDGAWIYRKD